MVSGSSLVYGMIKQITISLLLLGLCIGCTEGEVSLNRTEMKLVDSLYRQERDLLDPVLKDSCTTLRTMRLEALIDSIRKVRIEEIKKMIGEYE